MRVVLTTNGNISKITCFSMEIYPAPFDSQGIEALSY